MNREKWFVGLETKADMNSCAIGIIGEIMGEIYTTANRKVFEISCTLRDLDLAWNTKKALLQTEAVEEKSHPNCTIDLGKIEPLVDRAWAEEVLSSPPKEG